MDSRSRLHSYGDWRILGCICIFCVLLIAIPVVLIPSLIPVFLPNYGSEDIDFADANSSTRTINASFAMLNDGARTTVSNFNDLNLLGRELENQLGLKRNGILEVVFSNQHTIVAKSGQRQRRAITCDLTPIDSGIGFVFGIRVHVSSKETCQTVKCVDKFFRSLRDKFKTLKRIIMPRGTGSSVILTICSLDDNIYFDETTPSIPSITATNINNKTLPGNNTINPTTLSTEITTKTFFPSTTSNVAPTTTDKNTNHTNTNQPTTPNHDGCTPDKSKDKLSLAIVTLLNAAELQFNNPNVTLILQLSCPILDVYNYVMSVNDIPDMNTTSTTSNITILQQFSIDNVSLSFAALDIYGLPIFASFDLYFGTISMPVYLFFQNGSAAVGVLVYANLTDNPTVGQTGYTDSDGMVIFINVPSRTISLFARTIDNQIGLAGIAPTSVAVSLVLIPFGDSTSVSTTDIETDESQKSSVKVLRHITKRELLISAFTVYTAGQTLQIQSRTFMTDKTATSVYVRYKFVTSEVPGGYFGSRFNDYFTVTIRSKKGPYQTVSRSMNALGLAAFNYETGETDWFILKLKLNQGVDTIRVDVGVSNVGDSLYQSWVIVDKIAAEQCDKCDKCDKCPSNSMCQSTCINPPMQSCLFYTDCMEATTTCGSGGYALGFGAKYCNKFVAHLQSFSQLGQDWVYKTMNCLQNALVSSLQNCDNDCQSLKQIALDSHPACYVEAGVCSLSVSDWSSLVQIVYSDALFDLAGLKQSGTTFADCLPTLIDRINDEIKDAIDATKTKYQILLKTLKGML